MTDTCIALLTAEMLVSRTLISYSLHLYCEAQNDATPTGDPESSPNASKSRSVLPDQLISRGPEWSIEMHYASQR